MQLKHWRQQQVFSKDELFQYFKDFSPEQVLGAIAQLAAKDNSINPNAESFPSSIVDQLKAILKPVSIKKGAKQLAPVEKNVVAEIQNEEETISRQELLQYFDKYEPAKIDEALLRLGQDPSQKNYPLVIADRLDRAFMLIESALAKQEEAGLTGDLAQLQNLAFEMASSQTDIPQQIFAELIEVVTGKAIVQGAVLGKLSNLITEQVYQDTTADFLANKIDATGADIAALYEILQDPQKRNQILQQHGLKTDTERQAETLVQATSSTAEFDPDAFLKETEAKKFGQEPTNGSKFRPKTSKDIQKMSLAILTELQKF
ncbi:hypothetical protein I8748_32135 [Nostoc sp. CENA67]|uniref:Uncharacterized protein n=1 Tax=Amazonocrinis nigriterrae CENA67 TaxID=2794033 RepID=A0A8J7LAK0_9NOST|nr:hypothetical protein [Amazonocrinis nigriterrae]MBH8566749.1 hypothetical protein [Amazonocrinis nigriterrae CENA67]